MKKNKRRSNGNPLLPRVDLAPAGGRSAGRIAQVILNVDLRNSHDGLMAQARKEGVDFSRLQPGQYVVFINERMDKFKLLALSPTRRGAVVAYYKSYTGRIDREEIELLPASFGVAKRIETGEKAAVALDGELSFKRARRVGPEPIGKLPYERK